MENFPSIQLLGNTRLSECMHSLKGASHHSAAQAGVAPIGAGLEAPLLLELGPQLDIHSQQRRIDLSAWQGGPLRSTQW